MKEIIALIILIVLMAGLVFATMGQRASCVQQMVAGGSQWCEVDGR
jgi:hypothetical protein